MNQKFLKYVVGAHNSLDPFDLTKRSFLKRLLGPIYVRPLLNGSSGVMCTAELESERLVTYGAKPTHFLVPLTVPTILGASKSGLDFRRQYGIPESAFVVLFISRFDVMKGLQFLIPALANAIWRYP